MNSQTQNTKNNRKVVVAIFEPPKMIFKLPDGLDLEDNSIVKSYDFEYCQLVIYYVDGKVEKIDHDFEEDFNYICETLYVDDAEDYPVEYSDDEDDHEDDEDHEKKD